MLAGPLQDLEWAQVQLAVTRGGLGLRSAARHAGAAFVGSVVLSRTVFLDLALGPHYERALEDVSARVDVLPAERAQSSLSAAIDEKEVSVLEGMLSETQRARFLAVQAPRASAWISAAPCKPLGL